MKLLFVIFYELISYVKDIVECFQDEIICSYIPFYSNRNLDDLLNIISEEKSTHIFWFFLPEQNVFDVIRKDFPDIVHIYYFFDDPIGFNKHLFDKNHNIDIFIIPHECSRLKYEIMMKRKIYVIEKYHMSELLVKNEDLHYRISIMVTEYDNHDPFEKAILHQEIDRVIEICVNHNFLLAIYGDISLESIYPDTYRFEIEEVNEAVIYRNSDLIVNLDYRISYNKNDTSYNINMLASGVRIVNTADEILTKNGTNDSFKPMSICQWRDKIIETINEDFNRKINIYTSDRSNRNK